MHFLLPNTTSSQPCNMCTEVQIPMHSLINNFCNTELAQIY